MCALALLGAIAGSASVAYANGAYTHAHISQLAWRGLAPGPVHDLLQDPELQHACEAGSLFPDSGYGVSEPYGEFAHWEPFVIAYVADLRARFADDYSSSEARREIAFLLGVASHGMADQSYDTTLLARAFEVDGPEVPEYPVDQFADYFIVVDENVRFTVEPWAPYAVLSPLLERAEGTPISEARLTEAMELMQSLTRAQSSRLVADNLYWDAWEHYPFLGTHVYTEGAVGSLPWIATLVRDYWDVVWRRLHASDEPDEDLVIRTVPADGQENWPVSIAESESLGRIGVWFGYGVARDETTARLHLRAPDGTRVPVSYRTPYGTRESSLVFLVPDEPLAFATTYSIELEAGATTLAGRTSTRPFVSSFRTRCAETALDDCPPLPPPLVTGEVPMRPARPDAGPRRDAGEADDAGAPLDAGSMDPGDARVADGSVRTPSGDGGCRAAPGSRSAGLGAMLWLLAWIALRLGLRSERLSLRRESPAVEVRSRVAARDRL